MNENLNWDDLRLFLAVARAGGLAKAAPATDVSSPTLSRRMRAFERAVGVVLFDRRRDGYEITAAGRELLVHAEEVEKGALTIERWRTAADPRPLVRIAAGAWTSAFLARRMACLIDGAEDLRIEVLTSVSAADLLRREANLGLRNRRPEINGLAGRRLAQVAFAVYGADALVRGDAKAGDARRFAACPWVAFAPPGPKPPSAVWLDEHLPREARLTCSTPHAALEAAVGGVGLCILPCFIGDTTTGLWRASGIVADLTHDQWLVSHDDERHDKRIRQVAGRIAELIRSQRSLFAGDADA